MAFVKGYTPWNKDKKTGIIPQSSFKKVLAPTDPTPSDFPTAARRSPAPSRPVAPSVA